MFNYNEHKIISAIPLADIKAYLSELGAVEKIKLYRDERTGNAKNHDRAGNVKNHELTYECLGLEIKLIIEKNDELAKLSIPRHTISVQGDKPTAEKFLNDFRFRFMSAGG